MSTVADGKVVTFHYTLTNLRGDVLDSSSGRDPMSYLHGAGNVVPGLERQLTGRSARDRLTAVVPPEEAYGLRKEGLSQSVPREAFPEGASLSVGLQFTAETRTGEQIALWIVEISDDAVVVDPNHPLAGETLSFDVEIVRIRDATAEELAHGHPHGPGGHHHH